MSSGTPVSSPTVPRSTRAVSFSSSLPPPTVSKSPRTMRSITSSSIGRQGPPATTTPQYSQTIAKSMTIEEMRLLHQRALSDAEAKRTELRLVLASRYRELVGSSDEVLKMRERSEELHQLIHALPTLMTKLSQVQTMTRQESKTDETTSDAEEEEAKKAMLLLRRDLSRLPRLIQRSLDVMDVDSAATSLIELFGLISSQTDAYPQANVLSKTSIDDAKTRPELDPIVAAQIKMTYLYVQTIPARTIRMAKKILLQSATNNDGDAMLGAQLSASALCTLDLLDTTSMSSSTTDRSVPLLDLYFDSKAKLLQSLLNQLSLDKNTSDSPEEANDNDVQTENAELILSEIVSILQHDIILHPYLIFVKRNFPGSSVSSIMDSMPLYDVQVVRTKASNCLAAHLPLIRNKVKSVLVSIAGTTASALGKIRQSLYDKTDGLDCIKRLDSSGVCSWEEAVNAMVDPRTLQNQSGPPISLERKDAPRKFSLWNALFSNTFSSLVHSLLTSSFHSVHSRVVSTLRTSLANAPPFSAMLPHEAYRNTLKIATELDAALLKVSDDAHELLVHAEEREESERRLRQSLYVQTCEIMGRLICELRRMLLHKNTPAGDATKEFLVGRLCHLLKYRLTALPTLLNNRHSPAFLQGTTGGMITLLELQSAFDLADDNDDGLITFEEAFEAVDSAFSGTQFHGAEMIRETLLLSTKSGEKSLTTSAAGVHHTSAPTNVTLQELALLSARGLRHDASGPNSALGTLQSSLNDIIDTCFTEWSKVALDSSSESFRGDLNSFLDAVSSTSEQKWQYSYGPSSAASDLPDFGDYVKQESTLGEVDGPPIVGNVSPHVVGYMLSVSSVLNRSVCPSDSLMPASDEYNTTDIPDMMNIIRLALLKEALRTVAVSYEESVGIASAEGGIEEDGTRKATLKDGSPSGIIQLNVDVGFVKLCLFKRNRYGFEWRPEAEANAVDEYKRQLVKVSKLTDKLLSHAFRGDIAKLLQTIDDRHRHVLEVSDLYFSSLLGQDTTSAAPSVLADMDMSSSEGTGTQPFIHNPLPSSRRFGLLPIQSDRSLSELQRRGRYGKEKDEDDHTKKAAGGVVGGFFSAMLKKK